MRPDAKREDVTIDRTKPRTRIHTVSPLERLLYGPLSFTRILEVAYLPGVQTLPLAVRLNFPISLRSDADATFRFLMFTYGGMRN